VLDTGRSQAEVVNHVGVAPKRKPLARRRSQRSAVASSALPLASSSVSSSGKLYPKVMA
jgi:hypothetical protein